MAKSNLLSGRVKPVNPKNVSSDRYQFLDLSNAEPNLGVPNFSASLSGSPAIVVSDDQGNRGFVRSLDLDRVTGQFTGSFTGSAQSLSGSFSGSFTGSFIGDGSKLVNLPNVTFIASGSATASFVEGNLLVNTNARIQGDLYVDDTIYAESIIVSYVSSSVIYSSGSNIFGDNYTDIQQFTGSVLVSSSIIVNDITASQSISGSFTGSFFGDGTNLFNLPEATKLATGSVTASVTPQFGFRVLSIDNGSEFTGSVSISGSLRVDATSGSFILESSSVYYGEGKYLREIPRSALTEDALISTEIKSGSVTASVAPNFGFRVESVASGSRITGSEFVTGSMIITATSGALILGSSSAYYGEGTYLRNIPRNALTEDALISVEIKSGSVTASVSPNFGFVVTSVTSGSKFSGSLFVSGNIQLQNGFIYSGSGAGLFDIPLSALSEEVVAATRIQTGSITASVSPQRGFQVISVESGSQFTGSIFITGSGVELSSGSFSGSGARLFNIPKTAISDLDTSLIFSGSYTASINPDFGFRVNTRSTISGSFVVS